MTFPVQLTASIQSHNEIIERSIVLHKGVTVLLGPNGSGKTHFLRGLKHSFAHHVGGKKVRFLSAGRMGPLEQFRSDYNGYTSTPNYDAASYGGKGDVSRRHLMETINGDFQTLAERADILIKIQERLRKLFKRELLVEWDAGMLKILFSRIEGQSLPYSSGREASGLMHLVGILSALYDDEVGALLLDEPEVSLHPQLQAFLLQEIINVAGHPSEGKNRKIVIIATHSTEMIHITRPDDLLSLVFCYDLSTNPIQIPATAGELQNKKIRGLVARLGQEHKLSLFCKRPLLVEGPSDVMICSALSNNGDINLEASGSQLLPVIGKGQMPIVTKLLRLLGKEPVALADADGFTDGLDLINQFLESGPSVTQDAANHGFSSVSTMASTIYSDFCSLVQHRWPEISVTAETHPYWVNKKEGEADNAMRRAAFGTIFSSTDDMLKGLSVDFAWLTIKQRLCVLLDILEKSGLFILRRGSIESYYQVSDKLTSIGKPSAAADEMESITQLSKQQIQLPYNDILRCLRFASNTEAISEADALRDLLLSVVAPAHARLKSGEMATDFNTLARSLLGDRSKIFDLSVVDESLVVSISSDILDISGFPVSICKSDDAVKIISLALSKNT
jgi:energy-coupling factor transporter ATP-binding protein EcfA2